MPPPAASSAKAVDLSAGAAILADPGTTAGAGAACAGALTRTAFFLTVAVCIYLFLSGSAAAAATQQYEYIIGFLRVMTRCADRDRRV